MRTQSSLKGSVYSQLCPQIWDGKLAVGQLQGLWKGQNMLTLGGELIRAGYAFGFGWSFSDQFKHYCYLPCGLEREREGETADLLRNCAFLWMLMTKVLKQEKGMLLCQISDSEWYFILQIILLILSLVHTITTGFSGPTYRVRWAKVKGVAASCYIVL